MIRIHDQIPMFLRKNEHLNAKCVKKNRMIAVVCDKLENFIIPDGLKIEEQKGRYWLESCYTGEFLEIIDRKNESEFFKKLD